VTPADIEAALAELARTPRDLWPDLVRARFAGDAALAAQALVWLRASSDGGGDDDDGTPRLDTERYTLGVLLDVGASASVWQARDGKLGRDVAIKIFRGGRTAVLDEILAEARAACEVISDHVVRMLDVHDGNPPYIVMELVGEHEPRRGVLQPGASAAALRPASLDEAVRWVRDVARGVHDAHLRNVFHRDLKPHNVLITPVSRRARIADFGLAISAANRVGGATRIAGTPSHIAPEQARGLSASLDPHDLDERASLVAIDVWGLGALAYDLAGGGAPWRPAGDRDAWEVAASDATPARLVGVPRRLRRVIERAMAVEPRERYTSAGELADDLDAYLARRPTTHDRARPVRVWLWARRNPQLTLTAVLATGLAAIAAVAYMTVVEVREQRNALADEAARAETANAELEKHAEAAKKELSSTEADLGKTSAALDALKRTLSDANHDYRAIVAAKEKALENADAATKQLADELDNARSERDVAQMGRSMYEGFWTSARTDADAAIKERDAVAGERDAVKKERDAIASERDAAVAAKAELLAQRAQLVDERDRAESARRRAELDVARLAAQIAGLAGASAPPITGSAGSAGSATPIAPPPAGSASSSGSAGPLAPSSSDTSAALDPRH
jgi:serine/threonine protein kinase